jgi:hypothetical protein
MRIDDVASAPYISSPQMSHGPLTVGPSLPISPGQHSVAKVGPFTSQAEINQYIIQTKGNGNTCFTCGYPPCSHEGVFDNRSQAASHVRRVHLKEKPFECTWYACASIALGNFQSYGTLTAESTLRTSMTPIVMSTR